MRDSPFVKQTQVIDFKEYTQRQRRELELLVEENRTLRESANAFGDLAERLNTELQEARRGRTQSTVVRNEVQALC